MIILENMDKCYGCEACANICPKSAIKMVAAKDGFLYPEIDNSLCVECGACKRVCPSLNKKYENAKAPTVYAAMASDDIRKRSASGGIFTLLADYVFDKGGYVCGAAFDEGFLSVSHVMVKSKEDLDPLRRSKYIPSRLGDIYQKIEKALKEDKYVLFTGTPCQCAALKTYLKVPYEKLIVADLICHGTPSPLAWCKFLDEIGAGKKPTDVNFRYKDLIGWSSTTHVEFDDGTEYTERFKDDPFEQASSKNLILRKSCSTCEFARVPRQGDITIGDFWGIKKDLDDRKGTSAILVNTEKGKRMVEELSEKGNFKAFEEMPFYSAFGKNNANVYRAPHAHPGRQKFFDTLTGGSTFSEALSASKNEKYDAVLFSIWYAANYGSLMTNFALYKTLEDKGYNCIFADIPDHLWPKSVNHRHPLFVTRRFAYKHFKLTPKYKNKADLKKLNALSDTFIVGSDQIWNWSLCKSADDFFFLDLADGYKNKIAYGTSFGHDKFRGSEDERKKAGFYLKRFDSVSVREDYAVNLCKNEFGIEAREVLDPVFMCDKRHYLDCIKNSNLANDPPKKKYVLAYVLDPSEEIQSAIEDAAKRLDCDIVCLPNAHVDAVMSKNWRLPIKKDVDMEDWLYYFNNAEMVITDSFHGTCFSIIFEKKFAALANKRRGVARFYSLLKNFGLENRVVSDPTDFKENSSLYDTEIDYPAVNARIDVLRQSSNLWLDNALNKPKSPAVYTSYDILDKRIDGNESELTSLKAAVEKEDKKTEELLVRVKKSEEAIAKNNKNAELLKEIEKLKSEIKKLASRNEEMRKEIVQLKTPKKSFIRRALGKAKRILKRVLKGKKKK